MLDRPEIANDTILAALHTAFGLRMADLCFLPLGADTNTAVYRAESADGIPYFVKLRLDDFQVASLTVPRYLHEQSMQTVIPPLATLAGDLWTPLGNYHLILYPFVAGRPGYEQGLSAAHWREFGTALQQLHATTLPALLTGAIPHANFAPIWPAHMRRVLQAIEHINADEPIVQALAAFLSTKRRDMVDLITTTERLAAHLRVDPPEFVLCHGDCHGWNLLIDEREQLYLVDWDTVLFAPKERDLMFIGGGHGESGYRAAEEEALFYRGYGNPSINTVALAYYRFARALEDITLFAEQILTTDAGEDRQQALLYLQSNFLPDSTIARAYHALYYSSNRGDA